jgi:uncharacterized protein YndB with AHSA1/START domain
MTNPSLMMNADRTDVFGTLDVRDFTKAPLKSHKTIVINANASKVFEVLADHEGLRKWVPMINHEVVVNHEQSESKGGNGIGSVRVCNFGGDHLTETIKFWDAGNVYAYSVREDKNSPAVNHLAVFQVTKLSVDVTQVTWAQFFDPKPGSMKGKMMPVMMRLVMAKALKNLKKMFED